MHHYYFFIFSQYSSKMLYLLHKFVLLSKNNFILCRKRACLGQSFTECYLLNMFLKTKAGWSNDFRKHDLLHWNFRGSEMFSRKETWLSLFSSVQFSSVAQSCPTLCDPMNRSTPGLPVHPTPKVYPNSCPLSRWYHPTISSSVIPFSFSLQSFPALGSFQMSQLFVSGNQSIGVSASASVLPMNTQDWSPLGWTGWISLQSKGLARVFSNTTVQKHQFFGTQLSL